MNDSRFCRRNVLGDAPGSVCPECGRTSLVHPGPNDVPWCPICVIEAYIEDLRLDSRQ